jgi:hypothetical protein
MPKPGQSTSPTSGELQHTLSVYVRERDSLIGAIREARTEARRVTIEASSCQQPVPQATIDKWQRKIKESATELLTVEQKIGATNKALRALKSASKPTIKSLVQLPDDLPVRSNPDPANGEINTSPKEGRVLFLEFFRQMAGENLDPRMIEVLERDAHQLVNEYRRTHGRPPQIP